MLLRRLPKSAENWVCGLLRLGLLRCWARLCKQTRSWFLALFCLIRLACLPFLFYIWSWLCAKFRRIRFSLCVSLLCLLLLVSVGRVLSTFLLRSLAQCSIGFSVLRRLFIARGILGEAEAQAFHESRRVPRNNWLAILLLSSISPSFVAEKVERRLRSLFLARLWF